MSRPGWSYSYLVTGDVAGLLDGGLVRLPELGSTFFGGAGFSPYLYFYDENLNLIRKVDIIAYNITMFALVGLSDGGFVGIGNTDGGNYDTHLFYFDSSGNLLRQRDITADIPSLATKDFMNFTISSTNDGGVIVTELYGSTIWIYHSPPVQLDLSGTGVSSIGGIGGSYFQLEPTNECEGNFDCDADTDGTDAATFKTDFGRSSIVHPCIAGDTCNSDFTCDGDVDGTDASRFKQDFGRSRFKNPCPACAASMEWCSYP